MLLSKVATPQQYGMFALSIFNAHEAGDRGAEVIINRALHDLETILRSIDVIKTGRLYLDGSVRRRYLALLSDDIRRLVLPSSGDGLSGAVNLGLKLIRKLPSV